MFQMIHRTMNGTKPLRITCEDCGHGVAWNRAEAIERCGSDATPMDLRDKLRCGLCGSRRVLFKL
jgi:DNA-directed RNA polymerase subunit RPC12/RpoP